MSNAAYMQAACGGGARTASSGAGDTGTLVLLAEPRAGVPGGGVSSLACARGFDAFLDVITCAANTGFGHALRHLTAVSKATWTEATLWEALVQVRVAHQGEGGRTSLMFQAFAGNVARLRWLLARGARVSGRTRNGLSALSWAAQVGNVACIAALLDAGAGVDEASNDGVTPLHYAAWKGHLEAVELLLARGARREATSATGATALMFASWNGMSEMARVLLEVGVAVDKTDAHGIPSLMK